MKKEYKVEIIKEGALWSLLFGQGKLQFKKMERVMNEYGEKGWDVSFQLIERRRLLFFWSREAAIITFTRPKQ
mgnify:FL=1|tara:strand:+ start:333 stop:551 length:219 start_codon:yes stop_codon:yes gene_type:complete